MNLLTAQHRSAPKVVTIADGRWPAAALAAREDWGTLAAADIFRHEVAEGEPGHAGYSQWSLINDNAGPLFSRYPLIDTTAAGPAPLGYREWEERVDDAGRIYFHREPVGTADEIAAAVRTQRITELHALRSAERIRRQTGGFPHDGHIHTADREESIPLLTAVVIAAQTALSVGPQAVAAFEIGLGAGWRDRDNVPRITTATDLLALHGSFVEWGAKCDFASQALKAVIDTPGADLDDMEAVITADSSWPPL